MQNPHQTPYIGVHLMLIQDGKLLLQHRTYGELCDFYTPFPVMWIKARV